MATISAELRNHKEPTKDEVTKMFFGIPEEKKRSGDEGDAGGKAVDRMEINAVLSMGEQGVEDAYVRSAISISLLKLLCVRLITEKWRVCYIGREVVVIPPVLVICVYG